MKVMEFSEETKQDHVTPKWAKYMSESDFISYMPSYSGGKYLDLFEEKKCVRNGSAKPFDEITYYLYEPIKNGVDTKKKYPLLVFIHGASNALDGRKCIGHSGAEMFASQEYQEKMGGAFILVPLANERKNEKGELADSWCFEYVPLVKQAIDETLGKYKDSISGIFVIGGSSGGSMSWAMIEAYPDFFTGAIPVSTDYIPSSAVLGELRKNNVKIFYAVGRHDEFGLFSDKVISRIDELNSYDNITCFFPEWVRNGDKGIASLYFGIEMGQHCIITQIQADLMYDDNTPYCEALPNGVTGWIKSAALSAGAASPRLVNAKENDFFENIRVL